MSLRPFTVLLLSLAAAARITGAEEEETPKTNMKSVLRARMAEDAKKQPAPTAPKSAAPSANGATPAPPPATAPASTPANAASAGATPPVKPEPAAGAKTANPGAQPATVLPKVEVKKGRITELDQMLAKQEQDIARERKNLKTTETDLALNDAKVAAPLAIFGGESAQFRKRVASERVELMEAEKDVMEAMGRAKSKAEQQKLQKELDQLRAVRRELEKSLR
jgi:hypothetical protein